ncbi:gas vesicle protein [Streptosporangium carneum]|uniref:Gas vesicle protein n=1 Tax=Streptosporangium carneum TaxID=47481 RepID=A0A9W6HVC5_9ACTN|nr:gas vesicle protein [Streptosporangium carneum]GLK07020.1 hypothetical protein GCM10017600_04250 [Streptosporangium carneum]
MPARRGARDRRAADLEVSDDLYEEDEEVLDDEDDLDEDGSPRETSDRRARSRALSAATAGRAGLSYIAELTAKEMEGVTFVQPEENGWVVGVEVLEDRRVPSSGDILALYEVEMDREGSLLSYRRTSRYKRGKGDNSEASLR